MSSKNISFRKKSEKPELSLIVSVREFPNNSIYTLLDSTKKLSNRHEIIIVADRLVSTPQSKLQEVLSKNPNLTAIELIEADPKRGQGLSFARNLGAQHSRSNNLLFIDDDAAILDDVAPLVEYLDRGICHGIQPLLLRFDGETVDSAGDFVKPKPAYYQVSVRHIDKPVKSVATELKTEIVPSLRGAFMLIRKQSLLAVEGFDDTYIYQWDDVDVGWRLTLAGFKLLFVPNIRELHRGGGTTDLKLHSRERSMKFEILNSTATRLKVAPLRAWPMIMAHFLKLLLYYEALAMNRRKIHLNLHLIVKEPFEMLLLLLKRFPSVTYQRRMLSERFNWAGLCRFRAMVKGEHFVFQPPAEN